MSDRRPLSPLEPDPLGHTLQGSGLPRQTTSKISLGCGETLGDFFFLCIFNIFYNNKHTLFHRGKLTLEIK